MRRGVVLLALILGWGVIPTEKLQPKTVEAWNEFIRQTEVRVARHEHGESSFLFTDSLPSEQRATARSQMAAGQVYVLHLGGGSHEIDGG